MNTLAKVCAAIFGPPLPKCSVTGKSHDYKKGRGGDGIPSHFYQYTCEFCGEKFTI